MTVHTFGTFEAKNKLSELLDKVEQGEEVVITRHGKPVAKLVPATEGDLERKRKAQEAIEWMRENRGENNLDGDSIKGLIEEGRRF